MFDELPSSQSLRRSEAELSGEQRPSANRAPRGGDEVGDHPPDLAEFSGDLEKRYQHFYQYDAPIAATPLRANRLSPAARSTAVVHTSVFFGAQR
jgi:hypothetical protein